MAALRERIPAIAGWGSPSRIDAPLALDLAMLVLFAVARGARSDLLLGAWLVAVMLLAIVRPGSGLGQAAAIAVFPQPVGLGILPSVAVVAGSAVGVAIDLVRNGGGGPRGRWVALVLVGLVMIAAGTAIGLLHSAYTLPPSAVVEGTRRWLELGGALVFLGLLIHAFGLGSRRPLVLGMIGITVGLAVAIVDYLSPNLLPSLRARWLVFGTDQSRATGPFASPNRLGTVAAVAVVVGATQARGQRDFRWVWFALGLLGLVALTLSYSRGALLGLAVAGGAIVALRSRRVAIAYGVAVVVLAAAIIPLLLIARLSGSGGTLDALLSNDLGRFDAWVAGIRMIAAEPLLGHGYRSFAVLGASFGATDGLATAHNEAIGLWAEGGILAFVGYVILIVSIVLAVLDRRSDSWAAAGLGALLVFFVASSFNVQLMFLAVMGPVWIIVAYGIARPLSLAPDDAPPSETMPGVR